MTSNPDNMRCQSTRYGPTIVNHKGKNHQAISPSITRDLTSLASTNVYSNDSPDMVDLEFKPGQLIETKEGRQGTVRYVGELQIASGTWLGLELPDASGKNDGSVKGERYFTCKPGHGIFVREESVTKIVKQAVSTTVTKANGTSSVSGTGPAASAKSRPGAGITADVARRRQSLMSNGTGSVGGSRLSTRSPTKSPSKPMSTSASSTTSTPRAGTPSAAVKPVESTAKSRPSISSRPSLGPTSATARPTTTTARSSIGGSTNLRTTVTSRTPANPSRTGPPAVRPTQHARSISSQEKQVSRTTAELDHENRPHQARSPTIDEESGEEFKTEAIRSIDERVQQARKEEDNEKIQDVQEALSKPSPSPSATRSAQNLRTGNASNVESRTAHQREIEQLKAKIRTLEQKRLEDRDKLKNVEKLQSDKDRFEGIIQALQKKLKSNQQELSDARSKYEEAEARANATPDTSGEHESELELATLDKEMAEERAETCQLELDALKIKHEELELEVEILREENEELSSSLSPEDRASAGWLQMQREAERLRDALVRLRDVSLEKEGNLKAEVAELRDDLDGAQKVAEMYSKTAEKLVRAEETNKHLMDQLEAAETNEEIVEAMELHREQQLKSIEQLKNQIQDLEEHIQITDELENFHIDEEKRLHAQLDDSEALLNDTNRRNIEQDRIIEDLEYTLSKFRDVVQGLQSDIDELRRSRDISELQANEMSSKSRAMMDLNARLSNNATKTQLKIIDTEMDRVKAELAGKHVDILSMFTHEMFESEKKPISVLLGFGRIRSKAGLVGRLLGERLRERSHLTSGEEIFKTFEVMEQMEWLSETCHQFEEFMHYCDVPQFNACGSALVELEPVEQTVTLWVEALKGDELAKSDSDHLKRMRNILTDLSEKLIVHDTQNKATQHRVQMAMVQNYAESITGQLSCVTKMVQGKLGMPRSEDEESMIFDKKMDQLSTKARTIGYLSGKILQQLYDLRKNSLCLGETTWTSFEEAELLAEDLTRQVRVVGLALAEELFKLDSEEAVSYNSVSAVTAAALQRAHQSNGNLDDDPLAILARRLGSLHSIIDALQNQTSDLNNTIEFESLPSPWITRAKEIKSTKLIPPEVQEELTRLERRNVELGSRISEREKTIEEMGMRVELAEKRSRESREKDNRDKAVQEELNALRAERQSNNQTIMDLRNELTTLQSDVESTQTELETLRQGAKGEALVRATTVTGSTNSTGTTDESLMKQFELEANLLQAEITSLQAAIRYLRQENRSLRIPISEVLITSARNSWLDPSLGTKKPRLDTTKFQLEREGRAIQTNLIDIAKSLKPLRLSHKSTEPKSHTTKPTSWQPTAQTTRYQSLKLREELEKWESSRVDFVNRAKLVSGGATKSKGRGGALSKTSIPMIDGSNLVGGKNKARDDFGGVKKHIDVSDGGVGGLQIVES